MPILLNLLVSFSAAAQAPDIALRRELMVDRRMIERMSGAELRLQQPVEKEIAVRFDQPWEGKFSTFATVLHDGARFRLYYRGTGAHGSVTCYAESKDGITWVKPELGLVEFAGSKKNNIILSGGEWPINFTPMLDARPYQRREERFKALAGSHLSGLAAFVSADGIHWKKMREEPVFPPTKIARFDSQNLAFWSAAENRYVCYFRTFRKIGNRHVRWISRAHSGDFLNWSQPVEMSFGDAPPEDLYINQTAPYFRAPHLLVATAARFNPQRQAITDEQARAISVDPAYYKDTSDAVLLTSRGGTSYDRTFLESFVRPGMGVTNWVSRSNFPALNVAQTGPAEMSMWVAREYAQPGAHLRRYAMRLDGFASLHAGYGGGEMVTKPLRFSGGRLLVNYSTSAAGGLRVEIQDEAGRALPGYSLEECRESIGDEIEREIAWGNGPDVMALAGRTVRLRFSLRDADLFSYRFAAAPLPPPDRANVRYGPHERNVLDVWHARSNGPTPLAVFIHGGGFRAGDKNYLDATLLWLLRTAGISVAAINYRFTSQAPFPAPMHDAARAIQFLRHHAREWNLDSTRIGATGTSAGAGISLWLALHDDLADASNADPVLRQSTRLAGAAVVGAQTSYDPREVAKVVGPAAANHGLFAPLFAGTGETFYAEASPYTHASPGDPPLLLIFNEPDTPIPASAPPGSAIHHPRFGAYLKEKMERVGGQCEVRVLESPGYGIETQRLIAEFLIARLKP